MARTRLNTTVDATLLEQARKARSGGTDAALVDEALAALLARYRSAEIDASYAAYDEHPLDERDEWGDLASFRRAAAQPSHRASTSPASRLRGAVPSRADRTARSRTSVLAGVGWPMVRPISTISPLR